MKMGQLTKTASPPMHTHRPAKRESPGRLLAGPKHTRLRIVVRGAVQGVGFRPFVYRLATGMGLTGWVNNSPQGVFVEVEGTKSLPRRVPPPAGT